MKYARIVNNRAIDVRADSPQGCFTDNIVAEFQEVPDGVLDGWVLTGSVWAAPPVYVPTPEELAAREAATAAAAASALAATRALKWESIKSERDRRIQKGGYKVGTKWYHSDTFSRTQQMGLVMLGANIPANTPWKTMDGSFVTMTQTLAGQIFGTAAASDIAIFTAAENHNASMNASATPETYNHLIGWPVIYGE